MLIPVIRYFSALSLLVGATAALAGDNPVPLALPDARYAEMSDHSPFALATATPVAQPSAQSFAANWYVSGMAQVNGQDFVSIRSRDQAIQFSLHGHAEDPQTGVVLAGVDWSDNLGKSTVFLRKGAETARLEFNGTDLKNLPQVAAATKPAATGAPLPPAAVSAVLNSSRFASALVPSKPPEIRRRIAPIPLPR